MKKHFPWIGALLGVAGVLLGLHFVVFAPLKNDYDQVQAQLAQSVQSLKDEIGSIRWKEGKTPDPRKSEFSWKGLLEDSLGTYESNLAAYKDIVSRIDVSFIAPTEQEKTRRILERIGQLQEMEKTAKGKISVLEKWGLDTWNNSGYGGSRCLDLRWGGYRSYSGEDRISGLQGTVQFAFNLTPWKTTPEALASRDPKTAQMEDTKRSVLFHAARQKEKTPNLPEGAHPGFSSEIAIEKIGMNLIARVVGPQGQVFTKQVPMYSWLVGGEGAENPWKVVKLTWGPNPTDTNFYIDNKPADQVAASMAPRPMGGQVGGYGGAGNYNAYGGGGGYYGGGGEGYNPYGGGMGGMEGVYGGIQRAGQQNVPASFSLEPLDGIALGTDLKIEDKAPIQIDSVRIWDQVSATGDPLATPLFAEDFEQPFGSDEELKKGMDQVIRYHANYFDPTNSQEVKEKYYFWYMLQLGSAELYSMDKGSYIYGMWLISWLDHVSKTLPTTFSDPDRITSILTLPVALTDEVRQSLVIFLDLSTEVAKGLVDANVEKVESIQFLNWSHTINDEMLKASFKEAYTTLQDQVNTGAGGGMGMYGMYGAGMSPYGGGYGGGYGTTYYGGEEASYSDTDDPEKIAKAKEAAKKKEEEAMKMMQEAIEAQSKLKERQEKLSRWTPYYNTNQVHPEYYAEYREQTSTEGQQDFFLRYSMKTEFRTDRENLAKALYNLEFGSKLAFLSQLSLAPDANNPTKIDSVAHLEFNFMNDSSLGIGGEGPPAEGGETAPGEAPPVQSSQAPPSGTLPEGTSANPGQG